ncbi:galactokinase [Microbacterium sp. APC 3898]|uniref:Galactokinase n=1 Tax=Planococcus notacanthi TaxID=3035188 RepID=A0ABT7ZMS6_9BACL|nr:MULTISPECIES: galactokinase [Terrabacteria group]MDN3428476.1 galactokinase [Planococcus sp. APC 4016]MDN3438473.1 galactokinase [Planococcus sp. APC 3900]MDN3498817.1 galactokinase [Microbacterium sp. APC 3898]
MNQHDLSRTFHEIFGTAPTKPRFFFAPGRINLIGEHTDYNGGHVFPAAISFGTYAVARQRADQKLHFYSMNFPERGKIECNLADLSYNPDHDWANFPKGMIYYFIKNGYSISHGMDILFYGDIPNGAGLSSSASIEMATGVVLEGLFDLEIDRLHMIQMGQHVENQYIGVNSGIMDQFAIGKGKKDCAILLDCQTLEFHYAPVELKDHEIVIINSNKQRTLAASKYNERRAECEEALADLRTELPIGSLGELTSEKFEQYKHLITNDIHRKRAKHAVYENERTLLALQELEKGHLEAFGQLMNASHVSLRDDYEVTGAELDQIAETAWNHPGVIGARMTGAGFGGCAIAIVHQTQIEHFKEKLSETYSEEFGYPPSFYEAKISDGAKELAEEF